MLISKCCKAKMRVEGKISLYYVCTKCNKPCNVTADIKKELVEQKN